MPNTKNDSIAVLIPIFNDWAAVQELLPRLNAAIEKEHWQVTVILVDDASSTSADLTEVIEGLSAIQQVILVSLRRNLGHQRAIAVGLTLSHVRFPHDTLVVMDGDGQDRPEDVPRLVLESRRRGRHSHRVRRARQAV